MTTTVPMPETPMNKDGLAKPGQHQVRTPRQVLAMKAVTKPEAAYRPPNREFGRSVFASDFLHSQGSSCIGLKLSDWHRKVKLSKVLEQFQYGATISRPAAMTAATAQHGKNGKALLQANLQGRSL